MTRLCIVRDLSGSLGTTPPMDCIKSINLAKSGNWGKSWSLEECLENTEGSAPILQERIRFNKGKYKYIGNDNFFAQ